MHTVLSKSSTRTTNVSGTYHEYTRSNGERLIVGYSEQRAKKDAHNREKGIERLRKAYSSGVLTKASINSRGYNKFLTISKDEQVVINEQEIENDSKWDGLKGYVTPLYGKAYRGAHLYLLHRIQGL